MDEDFHLYQTGRTKEGGWVAYREGGVPKTHSLEGMSSEFDPTPTSIVMGPFVSVRILFFFFVFFDMNISRD